MVLSIPVPSNGLCLGFSPAPSNFLTPAGCPTIQLISDTVYPKIASDSTSRVFSPTSLPPTPTSDSNCKLRLSSVLLTVYRWQVSTSPFFGSINLLEQLTELRETFYLVDGRDARWGKRHDLPESAALLSEPHPCGVLWRFHYLGITDYIIGH